MAPMVPEPVGAGISGLIKPVCLLLAQVIRFRDQKQNTINPWLAIEGDLAEAMQGNQSGQTPQPQAGRPQGPHPPATRKQGTGRAAKDCLQQGPLMRCQDRPCWDILGTRAGRQTPRCRAFSAIIPSCHYLRCQKPRSGNHPTCSPPHAYTRGPAVRP